MTSDIPNVKTFINRKRNLPGINWFFDELVSWSRDSDRKFVIADSLEIVPNR